MSILGKHVCTNLNIQCLEILLDRQIRISYVHEYLRLEIVKFNTNLSNF